MDLYEIEATLVWSEFQDSLSCSTDKPYLEKPKAKGKKRKGTEHPNRRVRKGKTEEARLVEQLPLRLKHFILRGH